MRTFITLVALALTAVFCVNSVSAAPAENIQVAKQIQDPITTPVMRDPRLLTDTQLEADYWRCMAADAADVKAERTPTYNVNYCSAVSRFLQRTRFKDDFGLLHAWTQENKAAKMNR